MTVAPELLACLPVAARDNRSVELEMCACVLDWYGNTYETQVAASDGGYPLLGTMLLAGRRLDVNYAAKTVELT